MEEKLQFVPSLKDAFAIGMKNLVPIVLQCCFGSSPYGFLTLMWAPR